MHNRTDDNGLIWDDRAGVYRIRIKTMFFTIALLLAAVASLMLYRARMAGRVNPANLGWVSANWLAERRASRLS